MPLKEAVEKALTPYREEMVRFTEAMVRIPTENPPGAAYERCARLLGEKLSELGFEHRLHAVPEDAPGSLEGSPRFWLESYFGEGEDTLYFHGHYDVVPASSPEQFQPRRHKDNLFGRGTSDMKGGLASMLYAVKALSDCRVGLAGRIGFFLVPDEETGGQLGSGYLSEAGLLGRSGVGMLTAEPTGGVVWNGSRGAISLRVSIKGRPSHVGLHYRGVNAFEGMLDVAEALRELQREVQTHKTSFQIEPEAAKSSILMLGGQSGGGDNFNLVPGECFFTVDRRINPEEDLQAEREKMFAVFERLKQQGVDLDVQVFQQASSAGVSVETPLGRALAETIPAVTGRPARFELCPGILEIRFYAEQGIPAFALGPGLLSVSHGPNEYIKVSDMHDCAAIYALTAARLLGGE